MHVYFIRHGETRLNQKHIHQAPSTPLSEKGYEQARSTAEYLRPLNIDYLITSGYTRAAETARIIGETLNLTPHENSMLREVERPTKLFGESLFTFDTVRYVSTSVLKRRDPQWRYADAENFTDVHKRVQATLRYIESLSSEHQSIAVVTHAIYINLMIAYMCHGRVLALRDIVPSFLNIRKMENCGVVGVNYHGGNSAYMCKWERILW